VFGARPLDDPILLARFESIATKTSISMPSLYRAGSPQGTWANAFALPSRKWRGVLFTETLLLELDADEITATFCHELAHLEHFTPARLRTIRDVGFAVIALVTIGIPVVIQRTGAGLPELSIATLAVILAWVSWRVAGSQRRERESDARALVLCGNAEALISGLTKTYP
jgi:Zn-dependent protease with chaperone function